MIANHFRSLKCTMKQYYLQGNSVNVGAQYGTYGDDKVHSIWPLVEYLHNLHHPAEVAVTQPWEPEGVLAAVSQGRQLGKAGHVSVQLITRFSNFSRIVLDVRLPSMEIAIWPCLRTLSGVPYAPELIEIPFGSSKMELLVTAPTEHWLFWTKNSRIVLSVEEAKLSGLPIAQTLTP